MVGQRANGSRWGCTRAFWGKLLAPTTNRFGTPHTWQYLLTTEVLGSSPMTVPPLMCVDWYGTLLKSVIVSLTCLNRRVHLADDLRHRLVGHVLHHLALVVGEVECHAQQRIAERVVVVGSRSA